MVQEVSGHDEEEDYVRDQVGDNVGKEAETGRGELIDESINVGEIGVAHGVIVDGHDHLDDLKLQPLHQFGHHAVLEPAISVHHGDVDDGNNDEIAEEDKGRFSLFLFDVLDDVGGQEGNAIGLENVDGDAR